MELYFLQVHRLDSERVGILQDKHIGWMEMGVDALLEVQGDVWLLESDVVLQIMIN